MVRLGMSLCFFSMTGTESCGHSGQLRPFPISLRAFRARCGRRISDHRSNEAYLRSHSHHLISLQYCYQSSTTSREYQIQHAHAQPRNTAADPAWRLHFDYDRRGHHPNKQQPPVNGSRIDARRPLRTDSHFTAQRQLPVQIFAFVYLAGDVLQLRSEPTVLLGARIQFMRLAIQTIFVTEIRAYAKDQYRYDHPNHGFFVTPNPNKAMQARS